MKRNLNLLLEMNSSARACSCWLLFTTWIYCYWGILGDWRTGIWHDWGDSFIITGFILSMATEIGRPLMRILKHISFGQPLHMALDMVSRAVFAPCPTLAIHICMSTVLWVNGSLLPSFLGCCTWSAVYRAGAVDRLYWSLQQECEGQAVFLQWPVKRQSVHYRLGTFAYPEEQTGSSLS